MIPKMRREADHPEKYSVEERYALARHVIRLMKVTGGIHTKSYGTELLPTEGGYMMYPNHQGKVRRTRHYLHPQGAMFACDG